MSAALLLLRRQIPFGKTALIGLAVLAYWLLYWVALQTSPLGRDIDFDGDGNVSLMEALDGAEIQTRTVQVNGKRCVEYLAPKTGSTWRLVCQ